MPLYKALRLYQARAEAKTDLVLHLGGFGALPSKESFFAWSAFFRRRLCLTCLLLSTIIFGGELAQEALGRHGGEAQVGLRPDYTWTEVD